MIKEQLDHLINNDLSNDLKTKYHFWRISIQNHTNGYIYISGIDFRIKKGSKNLPIDNGIAKASSEYNLNYKANFAFNENTNYFWMAGNVNGRRDQNPWI